MKLLSFLFPSNYYGRLHRSLLFCVAIISFTLLITSPNLSAETCSSIELQSDVNNCGTCGFSCYQTVTNSNWSCQFGVCNFEGCKSDYYDLDGDDQCEYYCLFKSAQESCNGLDDNCNGVIDENITPPSIFDVCGVNPAVSTAECTTNVTVSCQSGSWQCNFPDNVCTDGCSQDDEICDALDNDCDGALNENTANYGQSCRSDDGLSPPGHGRCVTEGTFVCDGESATVCSAQKADCAALPGGCVEECDGVDNDCDGLVDETYLDKGTNTTFFVQPFVTKISSNRWIYSYEASRPDATLTNPGYGNGFHCQNCPPGIPITPANEPLDRTRACSEPNRLPWFGVSPIEAEQTCNAMGGFICDLSDFNTACESTASCQWGYSPRGSECTSLATVSKYCNLASSYDFDSEISGRQTGLLETGSTKLSNCFADWTGLLGNTNERIFDLTGNLHEITKVGTNVYPLLGGSFKSEVETGATCSSTFQVVDQDYKSSSTGFRCCFNTDPRF